MEEGLLEKTGKTLEQWIKVVQKTKLDKHKAIIDYLKAEHGFTHGYANLVALKARGADAASHDADDLLTNQYKGKESLKPIYDELLKKISKFGKDITITPKKDSVSFIRKKQFALIKPATKTRIDLGLKLKDKPTTDRLGNSGPFGTMCTHRVQLTDKKEVDKELLEWLKEAYEKAE
ncbi:MAG: DUF4287 domain-containing protein [Chitinophagales bacterium]|nr:DUF4287 domain-containing protein [Chitinophagaceae bacterium]MCB9065812.1 DUF4287 domain-containing protein [Chitinophagales bacterium]